MIMSPLAKLEMTPCKGAIIIPLEGVLSQWAWRNENHYIPC